MTSARIAALLNFLDASPSPFHAVKSSVEILEKHNFVRLSEASPWKLERNGKYVFTRNGSALLAFTIGGHLVLDCVIFDS